MAADTSVVKPIEAPPLAPLQIKSKLAATPGGPPKYPVTVKSAADFARRLRKPEAEFEISIYTTPSGFFGLPGRTF
jgi:hypothetical protein